MGGIREGDRKRLCFFFEKGNSDTFYGQLEQLNEFVKEEWVGQGNRIQDFKEKGPRIIIVLDNDSYHKKQAVIDKIAQNMPNIMLEFLPAYSPDYNIIELVWDSCKEYIAHRLFKSVGELKDLFR